MSSRHQRALDLIGRLQRELGTMTYRDPAGPSYSLEQMYGRQLEQIRATVEYHTEYEQVEQARVRVTLPSTYRCVLCGTEVPVGETCHGAHRA